MFEIELIQEVQKHSCVYDKTDPDFRSKFSREQAWNSIGVAVGMPVEQCQSRWRSLRDRFVRDLNKRPNLKTASTDAIKNERWQFFEAMHFLTDFITTSVDQKTFEENLIREVQARPCIYDNQDPNFRTKLAKCEAWEEISASTGASVDQCQLRWKTLRDRFVVEVNKNKTSYWAYFQHLHFLKDHLGHKKNSLTKLVEQTLDEVDLDQDSTPDTIYVNHNQDYPTIEFEAPIECEAPTTSKATKRKAVDEARYEFYKIMAKIDNVIEKNFLKKSESDGSTQDDSFHQYLESILRKVDENDRDRIQVDIIAFAAKRVQEVKEENLNNIIIKI